MQVSAELGQAVYKAGGKTSSLLATGVGETVVVNGTDWLKLTVAHKRA